ncbi:MAG: stage V sporulation protein AE [Ruminococcus sp.]|nr:stage V sporulation protein AE [Ruminococcus sp.]
MQYIYSFLVGGAICVFGQILIDKTSLTPARILTSFVVAGVALTALGLYEPLVDFAGAGATVPISGFGYLMANGIKNALTDNGILGILSGALTASAAGIACAIVFSYLAALISRPGDKS